MHGYRPEVDGLRAAAVVAVLLFHIGMPGFSGGYVGVDVFFVISGYLITRLIRDEVATGIFTFRKFYVRRARRLLPALFFTLAISLVAASLLFSPAHLVNFAWSLGAAALSISNVLFWSESGYFDLTAFVKPLLHTWSLGIEEQFYLIWPVLLVLLLRRPVRQTLVVIGLAGVASFGLNFAFASEPSTIFYLLPFRVFEFAIGAAMVWVAERQPRDQRTLEPLAFAGLALIGFATVAFTDKTLFPSYNALVPCIGTALILYAGNAPYTGRLLNNPVAVGVGLISYSLYLIHWPLIVFYRYFTLKELGLSEKIAICVVAVVSAILMYYWIEAPFRSKVRLKGARHRPFVAGMVTSAAMMIAAGFFIDKAGGWKQRLPAHRVLPTPWQYELQEHSHCGQSSNEHPLFTCVVDRKAAKDIYVWGDSHARHLVAGLAAVFPRHNVKVLYFTGCRPQSGLFGYRYEYEGRTRLADDCAKRNADALSFFSQTEPTNIVLHYFMSLGEVDAPPIAASTTQLIAALTSLGHNVKLLGDVLRPNIYLPDCFAVPLTISDERQKTRCSGDQATAEALAKQNDRFQTILGAHFINPNASFISDGGYGNIAAGQLLFRDTNHLTAFGSEYLIKRVSSELAIR